MKTETNEYDLCVGEMLRDKLYKIGADGLCNPIKECGCSIDDLAPCGCIYIRECVAAKKSRKDYYTIM